MTHHSTPWVSDERIPFDDDVWELYAPGDWTQAHDLAAEDPKRLHDLQRLFILEAGKYGVFPSTTACTSGSTPISRAARSSSAASHSCCSAAWAG